MRLSALRRQLPVPSPATSAWRGQSGQPALAPARVGSALQCRSGSAPAWMSSAPPAAGADAHPAAPFAQGAVDNTDPKSFWMPSVRPAIQRIASLARARSTAPPHALITIVNYIACLTTHAGGDFRQGPVHHLLRELRAVRAE